MIVEVTGSQCLIEEESCWSIRALFTRGAVEAGFGCVPLGRGGRQGKERAYLGVKGAVLLPQESGELVGTGTFMRLRLAPRGLAVSGATAHHGAAVPGFERKLHCPGLNCL